MTPRNVVIIGGKGTAINIAEQIEEARLRFGYPMAVAGFAIDDPALGLEIAGLPVLCGIRELWPKFRYTDVLFIFALYRPDVMAERVELLRGLGVPVTRFANFVHPTAYLSPRVIMGHGNVVLSSSCVQHGVSIGNFNILNSNVVVEHDACFQDASFVAASACIGARVKIGVGAFVGLNATVREDVSIEDYGFVGMGSVLVRSVDKGVVVYGSPAGPRR